LLQVSYVLVFKPFLNVDQSKVFRYLYEDESIENFKYVLSRNLLNTKDTQRFHFSM